MNGKINKSEHLPTRYSTSGESYRKLFIFVPLKRSGIFWKVLDKFLSLALLVVLFAGFSANIARSAIKDSDADGLSDEAEINQYRTDPNNFDTDGDGRGDGDEILENTDPLNPQSSRIAELSVPDFGIWGNPKQFAWYMGRASGILAFILLSISVACGLIISSRAFLKVIPGAIILEAHRFVAWLALLTIVVHISSFFFDNFLRIGFMEALVPFVLARDFKTTLGFDVGKAAALGIIGFYLVIILVLTSEFRAKISAKVWRRIHYSSFAAYVLFILHAFTAGTDSGESWMRAIYSASVSVVALLILTRFIFRTLVPKWKARKLAVNTEANQANQTVRNI